MAFASVRATGACACTWSQFIGGVQGLQLHPCGVIRYISTGSNIGLAVAAKHRLSLRVNSVQVAVNFAATLDPALEWIAQDEWSLAMLRTTGRYPKFQHSLCRLLKGSLW
jgi:hypothetical protein